MSRPLANTSFELEDDKNDFLQRALNSSFASLNTRFPPINASTAQVRLHSHSIPFLPSQAETRLRSEQVALKLKESKATGPLPKTRDLSFLEPEVTRTPIAGPVNVQEPENVFSDNLETLMSSAAKVVLVNSEIFDEDKLRHFCKSMLKKKDTERFSFLPVKGLGNPVNRRDAELLTKWVEKMENQVMAKGNAREFFEGLQVVYGLCLKELTRQIAVHCYERGALLDRILSAYVFLFEKVIQSYKKDIHKLDYDSKAKTAKLHELYLWQLDEFKKKLHEQSYIAENLKEEVETAKQTEVAFIAKERNYQDRVKKLQINLEETSRKLTRFEKRYGVIEDSDMATFGRRFIRDPTAKSTIKGALFSFAKLASIEAEVDTGPYAIALFLFQHFLTKNVIRFTGVEGEFITYQSQRCQTRWKRFPIPLVQVESSEITADFIRTKVRRASSVLQLGFKEDESEIERLVVTLVDMEMLMKDVPLEKLPDSLKTSYSTLKLMLEKCVKMSKSAQKFSTFLSHMVKKMQTEEETKDDAMLSAENRCKILEKENAALKNEIDDLRNRLQKKDKARMQSSRSHRSSSRNSTIDPNSKQLETVFEGLKKAQKKILFKRSSTLPSTLLLEKFNAAPVKAKCVMTVKTLLKQLSSILSEYQIQSKANSAVKSQELVHFCYDWLMTKHGLKGVTEQKFVQLLSACDFFKENPKVHLFARFLQLYEPLSGEDFRFFVSVVSSLNHWGSSIDMGETDDAYVGSSECYQVLLETLIPKFPDIDPRKLRFELEMQADRLNKFRIFDFLNFAIKRFRVAMSTNQNYVMDIFKAADLNGDGFLELREFVVLCRQIVKEKNKLVNIRQVFANSADLMVKYNEEDDPKPVISLDKFAALSVEYDLFGPEAQRKFLEIESDDDIAPLYSGLQSEIDSVIGTLRSRIPLSDPRYEALLFNIDLLDKKMRGEGDDRIYYIAYKLLDGESKRVFLR